MKGRGKIKCSECQEYLDIGMPTLNCDSCNPEVTIEMNKENAEKFIIWAKSEWSYGWEMAEDMLKEGKDYAHQSLRYANIEILEDMAIEFDII